MLRSIVSLSVLHLLLLFPLSAAASDLKVAKPWVNLPIFDEPAPAYFMIQNRGDKPRKLLGANSPRCEKIEIHRAVVKDGAMTSEALDEWEIPAGGAVAFMPRGLFLMLSGAKDLAEGEMIPIELEFADGEKLQIDAVVREE
jgi:copper(I)-binding protein